MNPPSRARGLLPQLSSLVMLGACAGGWASDTSKGEWPYYGGDIASGGPLVSATLLFVNQVQTRADGPGVSATEFYMRAFDKKNGKVLWESKMPEPPYGTPMTYRYQNRQYIVVATGGGGVPARLQAFALPARR